MKIHQLPQGARFEYEGVEHVKTGPMSGTGQGGQRLIPRYAVLNALDNIETTRDPKNDALHGSSVLSAFDAFYTECKALVPKDKRVALDAARERLLRALD